MRSLSFSLILSVAKSLAVVLAVLLAGVLAGALANEVWLVRSRRVVRASLSCAFCRFDEPLTLI